MYSITAGMFNLPFVSTLTALMASNQVRFAGDTNCSHRTNISVVPSQFLNLGCSPAWHSPASESSQSYQPSRCIEGLSRM